MDGAAATDFARSPTSFYGCCSQLRGHLDGVREGHFIADTLVTVAEDCVVKLWDAKQFAAATIDTFIEPYATLRGTNHCHI